MRAGLIVVGCGQRQGVKDQVSFMDRRERGLTAPRLFPLQFGGSDLGPSARCRRSDLEAGAQSCRLLNMGEHGFGLGGVRPMAALRIGQGPVTSEFALHRAIKQEAGDGAGGQG